jgi:hypothetical protein
MTQHQYNIKRKLIIVDFAEQLGNISEACRKLGVSRQHYCFLVGQDTSYVGFTKL